MDGLWAQFASIAADPYPQLAKDKEATGKKVIGCFPMHAPEELIHAAGMLPITIFGSHDPIGEADAHIQPYVCSIVRSSFDRGLRGELKLIDGIIFPDICDAVQCLSDIWRSTLHPEFAFSYVLPAKTEGALAERYAAWELGRLRSALEQYAGRAVSDDDLRQSIALFNRHRALLRRLYDLRRANPGLIPTRQMSDAVVSGMVMPKEQHCALLESLLDGLAGAKPGRRGVPVILSGSLCDDPDSATLAMLEELGAVIVDDDLYTGSKYLLRDAPVEGDPLVALARRDSNSAPCPTRHDLRPEKDPANHLLKMVEQTGAQAVVILQVKFCEPHGFEYPYIKERLEGAGVPHFLIETEHEMSNLGQVRTRLQAFFEMVGGE